MNQMPVVMQQLLRRTKEEIAPFLNSIGIAEVPVVVDENDDGDEIWSLCDSGIQLRLRQSIVAAVILHGTSEDGFESYRHEPYPSLGWGIPREQVIRKLGQPTKNSDARNLCLITVKPWVRYDNQKGCVRFQFDDRDFGLQQVTYMLPEAAPGLTPIVSSSEWRTLNEQNHHRRLQAYSAVLGLPSNRLFDNSCKPDIPQVDVLEFPPNNARSFFTLVTSGMSDLPMYVDADEGPRRAELIFYVPEPKDDYSDWLQWAAQFPFVDKTSLDHGHTIEWLEPLFDDSDLSAMLFLYTILKSDAGMCREMVIGGETVDLLWYVPITRNELELKRKRGLGDLLDLFDANDHPVVINEKRASYS